MTAKHFPASDKATLPGRMSAKVVGLSFVVGAGGYPDNLAYLDRMAEDGYPVPLALVHQPDNAFDTNAVAVCSAATGRHIGHLPAALAARIAPEVDRWSVASYEVLISPGHEDHPGLSLSLVRS